MPWTPTQTLLTTTDELQNLSFTISYVPDPSVTSNPATVTVTPVTSTPYIQVNAATISGYFSDSFNYSVNYIDRDNKNYTVSKFSDIDTTKLYQLYKYTPNMTPSITYTYNAVAKDSVTNSVLDTKTYSIVVTQNWTTNKMLLQRYVSLNTYLSTNYLPTSTVTLINSSGNKVTLLNNSGQPLILENA